MRLLKLAWYYLTAMDTQEAVDREMARAKVLVQYRGELKALRSAFESTFEEGEA